MGVSLPETVNVRPWVSCYVASAESSFDIFECTQGSFSCAHGHGVRHIREVRLCGYDHIKRTTSWVTTVHSGEFDSSSGSLDVKHRQLRQKCRTNPQFGHLRQKRYHISENFRGVLHSRMSIAKTLQGIDVFISCVRLRRILQPSSQTESTRQRSEMSPDQWASLAGQLGQS